MRLEAAGKKSKTSRDHDRDVSEKIALGLHTGSGAARETQYDQRLFNQSQGIGSGFGAEDDYNVFNKPLFAAKSDAIYRPRAGQDADKYGSAEDQISDLKAGGTSKFRPDKDFAGVDRSGGGGPSRDGPVQFEKQSDDPFGMNKFITEDSRSRGGGAGNALDKVGGGGGRMSMSASGKAADYEGGSSRSNIKFQKGGN